MGAGGRALAGRQADGFPGGEDGSVLLAAFAVRGDGFVSVRARSVPAVGPFFGQIR